ncbi:MAG: 4-alpha-glucanotransferase, partial [Gemmatimonadales bacterium]
MTRPAHRRGSRALRTLAGRMGILPDFVDVLGRRRRTSDATRETLLAAMGCPAASDAEARAILERLDDSERERVLAPVQVVRGNIPATLALSAQPGATSYELEVIEETGIVHRSGGALRGRGARVPFPSTLRTGLPPGYHRVRVRLGGDHAWHAEQLLIVAPLRCAPPRRGEGRRNRRFGLTVNLWTVSSARNWGAGDFTDLAELAEWAGAYGAAFIGVNPLYALRCRRGEESPYNPLTRLFRNPLYLDVTAVPEFAESAEARQLVVSPAFRTALDRVRDAATVDHVAVMTLKRDVLRALFRTFCSRHAGRETPRDLAYRRYLAERGSLLDDFATFLALEEHFGMSAWPAWPDAFHDPRGQAARAFRAERAEAVDFHRWVQFELDRQLATAAGRAAAGGVANGFVGDLPVGTAAASSDAWAFPGLFARGVHIGAPPDEYAREGQDWGLAPLDPHRLRADRHAYWTLVVRAALAHKGALRVDHVMGLLRQYWIPAGRPAAEGAYVRYPADDL